MLRHDKTKLKALKVYEDMSDDGDSLALLKEIKGISYRFETRDNIYSSTHDAKAAFYKDKQGKDETNSDYLSRFKDIYQVVEYYGGNLCDDDALIKHESTILLSKKSHPNYVLDRQDLKEATMNAKQRSLAMCFFKGADKVRYGALQIELKNNYSRGTDQYAKNVTEVYNLLVSYTKTETPRREPRDRGDTRDRNPTNGGDNNRIPLGASFAQATAQGNIIQCYNCQETGHMANGCTNLPRTRAQGVAGAAPTVAATTTGAAFLMTSEGEEEETNEQPMFSFNMTDESVRIDKNISLIQCGYCLIAHPQ